MNSIQLTKSFLADEVARDFFRKDSNEQCPVDPVYLLYIGDYTTQIYPVIYIYIGIIDDYSGSLRGSL